MHAGADQGQRVAGKLTTGARDGSAGQQNQDARVGAVGAVLLQVAVLQGLWRDGKKGEKINMLLSFKVLQGILLWYAVLHKVMYSFLKTIKH